MTTGRCLPCLELRWSVLFWASFLWSAASLRGTKTATIPSTTLLTHLVNELNREQIIFREHVEGALRFLTESEFELKETMDNVHGERRKCPHRRENTHRRWRNLGSILKTVIREEKSLPIAYPTQSVSPGRYGQRRHVEGHPREKTASKEAVTDGLQGCRDCRETTARGGNLRSGVQGLSVQGQSKQMLTSPFLDVETSPNVLARKVLGDNSCRKYWYPYLVRVLS
jgi:hypothetical protein